MKIFVPMSSLPIEVNKKVETRRHVLYGSEAMLLDLKDDARAGRRRPDANGGRGAWATVAVAGCAGPWCCTGARAGSRTAGTPGGRSAAFRLLLRCMSCAPRRPAAAPPRRAPRCDVCNIRDVRRCRRRSESENLM